MFFLHQIILKQMSIYFEYTELLLYIAYLPLELLGTSSCIADFILVVHY